MSFASSLASPLRGSARGAQSLLRSRSLHSMARAVGVVVGAGALGAVYQIATEEGRHITAGLRNRFAARRDQNNTLMLHLLRSELPLPTLNYLRKSRNILNTCIQLSTDEKIPPDQRAMIRAVLNGAIGGPEE